MGFTEIERLVGRLPKSARESQRWWNSTRSADSGAHPWLTANWRIDSVDSDAEQVTFVRDPVVTKSSSPRQDTQALPMEADDHRAVKASWRTMAGEIAAGLVAAGAAATSELVGLAHLPWPALLTLVVSVGVIAWTMTQAITVRKSPEPIWWWPVSSALLVFLALGAFMYHKLLDPATRAHRTYEFVVNGGEANVIPLFGEAGGSEQLLATGAADQNALIGGQGYAFDCWTIARNGAEWLRYERFDQTWWAPRKYLHPPFGETEPPLPHC